MFQQGFRLLCGWLVGWRCWCLVLVGAGCVKCRVALRGARVTLRRGAFVPHQPNQNQEFHDASMQIRYLAYNFGAADSSNIIMNMMSRCVFMQVFHSVLHFQRDTCRMIAFICFLSQRLPCSSWFRDFHSRGQYVCQVGVGRPCFRWHIRRTKV